MGVQSRACPEGVAVASGLRPRTAGQEARQVCAPRQRGGVLERNPRPGGILPEQQALPAGPILRSRDRDAALRDMRARSRAGGTGTRRGALWRISAESSRRGEPAAPSPRPSAPLSVGTRAPGSWLPDPPHLGGAKIRGLEKRPERSCARVGAWRPCSGGRGLGWTSTDLVYEVLGTIKWGKRVSASNPLHHPQPRGPGTLGLSFPEASDDGTPGLPVLPS